jgi:hypothetical protein
MNSIPTIILLIVLIVISAVILRACKCSESFIRMVRHTKWVLFSLKEGKYDIKTRIHGTILNNKFIGQTDEGVSVTFPYTDRTIVRFGDIGDIGYIGYVSKFKNSRLIQWEYTVIDNGGVQSTAIGGLLADVPPV